MPRSVKNTILKSTLKQLKKYNFREKIEKTFPKGFTFGKISGSSPTVTELLTENIHHDIQKDIENYISFLTPLRENLKNRVNRNLLNFVDLHESLKYYDKVLLIYYFT